MPNTTLAPLLTLLHQMRQTIERLDDRQYAMPAPGRSSGGIGGHVRHCLDHISALLAGTCTGLCAYDRRQRGTAVETSRAAAIEAIADTTIRLQGLDAVNLESEVFVETQLDSSRATVITRSTLSREVVFLVSHTIHHNAIVGQMLQARGFDVAPRFGFAAATPTESCVREPAGRGALRCAL
jgi:hypothetical protein